MLINCPHHYHANEVLVHTFIEVLQPNAKVLLNSTAGEQAIEKTYVELFALLNKISEGNLKWTGDISRTAVEKTFGVLEVDHITALLAQLVSMHNIMNTHFSKIALGQQQQAQVNAVQQPQGWCEVCGSGKDVAEHCGENSVSVNFL